MRGAARYGDGARWSIMSHARLRHRCRASTQRWRLHRKCRHGAHEPQPPAPSTLPAHALLLLLSFAHAKSYHSAHTYTPRYRARRRDYARCYRRGMRCSAATAGGHHVAMRDKLRLPRAAILQMRGKIMRIETVICEKEKRMMKGKPEKQT